MNTQPDRPDSYEFATPPLRPGKLIAVSVIAIVLGSLGLLSAASQSAGLAFGKKMQRMQMGMGQDDAQVDQAMQEMFDEINRISDRYFVVNVVILAVEMIVSVLLIYAAIRTLLMHPRGRALLRGTLLFTAVFVCLRLIPTTMLQLEMMPITQAYTKALMTPPAGAAEAEAEAGTEAGAEAGGPPQAMPGPEFGGMIARIQIIVAIVFMGGWALIQVVYYVLGYIYLGRPTVVELFAAASP